jgi:hypothetical protein
MSEQLTYFSQNFPEFISCSIGASFHKLKIFEQFYWLLYAQGGAGVERVGEDGRGWRR